jgi:hypothetical protein
VALNGKRYGRHIVSACGLSIYDVADKRFIDYFHTEALSAAIKTNSRFNAREASDMARYIILHRWKSKNHTFVEDTITFTRVIKHKLSHQWHIPKGNIFESNPDALRSKMLDLGRGIRTRLCDNQCVYPHENIILMEGMNGDKNIVVSKFGIILDKASPQLFFALLESDIDIDMNGVIY